MNGNEEEEVTRLLETLQSALKNLEDKAGELKANSERMKSGMEELCGLLAGLERADGAGNDTPEEKTAAGDAPMSGAAWKRMIYIHTRD